MNPKKVFCVGFNKTGTTTIKRCFAILDLGKIAPTGGKILRPINHAIFDHHNYEPALKLAEQYTCFEDRPWNIWKMYRFLDKRFPEAKFILTIRNSESWWKSVEQWISITKPWMRRRYREHLGAKDMLKNSMISAYENYNQEVISYFRTQQDKLLVLNLEEGLAWAPICQFFGKDIPKRPFPHANRQSYDQKDVYKSLKRLDQKPWGKNKLNAYRKYLASLLSKRKSTCFYCGDMAVKFLPDAGRYINELDHILQNIPSVVHNHNMDRRVDALDASNRPENNIPESMAIVCCYINPKGSKGKKESYDHFYKAIKASGLTLLTVELIFPELGPQLAGHYQDVITIECRDLLWSEQYLLNMGIRKLIKDGYQKIVWLEPTITIDNTEKWMRRISDALDHHMFVQAYSDIRINHKNKNITKLKSSPSQFCPSGHINDGCHQTTALNYGWAARADLLKDIGLYDRALFGRGAIMIYIASFGYSDEWIKWISKITHYAFSCCAMCRKRVPAPHYTWHYLTWAQKWADLVKGSVGCVDHEITLLEDNENADFEQSAFLTLLKHGYDPVEDIIIHEDKTLQWSAGKRELKEKMDDLIRKSFS